MDPTQRFSDRVENYVRHRPSYPPGLIPWLTEAIELSPQSVVADIGSGTGISASLFLRNGNPVFAIEPNAAMRAAAEKLLRSFPRFKSVDGTSAATGLPDASVDVVTAFQAFHWFDVPAARKEFARILRPAGWVVLVRNDRRLTGTPFLEAYEDLLLRLGTDYLRVRHNNVTEEAIRTFLGPGTFKAHTFSNEQRFDFEGLKGRLVSSSYVPAPDNPGHEPMIRRLMEIFERFQENGVVTMTYDTRIYTGRFA